MILKEMQINNFRNYENQILFFSPNVNILVGENAQGKTNALEAIHMLSLGKSYRAIKDVNVLKWGSKKGSIIGKVEIENRLRELRLEILTNGKKASINGISLSKMTDYVGHFQVVLFAPEDLQLVKGSPSIRRKFLDIEIGQTYPKYLYHLSQYMRVIQQRNILLKNNTMDEKFLDVFDQQLILHGSEILIRRKLFLKKLEKISRKIYQIISDGREEFTFSYLSTIDKKVLLENSKIEEVQSLYEEELLLKRENDFRFGSTTIGPHRDDIHFYLNQQSVQSFASQGQQRSIALALRLAEIELIHDEIGEYPVLLLDDVLSELDDLRQKNLILSMSDNVQIIITTTNFFKLQSQLDIQTKLFHVSSGIIHEKEQ